MTAELIMKNDYYTITDSSLSAGSKVAVYKGTMPTLTKEGKEKVGDFENGEFSFARDEMDTDCRNYYFYQFGNERRIVAERNIPLQGTFNCRDLGGYQTKDGRITKWGKIFRSDALNTITASDVHYLSRMGIKSVVDFRASTEIESAPDISIEGVEHFYLNPNAEVAALATGNLIDDKTKIAKLLKIANSSEGEAYFNDRLNEMADQMRELVSAKISNERYRDFLKLLTNEENMPLLEHCKGGKDRAGFAAMLVLMVLDVPKETIIKDYLLTKENMQERNKKRMDEYKEFTDHPLVLQYLEGLMSTKQKYIDAAFEEMDRISENTESYLKEIIGITEEEIFKIRKNLLY